MGSTGWRHPLPAGGSGLRLLRRPLGKVQGFSGPRPAEREARAGHTVSSAWQWSHVCRNQCPHHCAPPRAIPALRLQFPQSQASPRRPLAWPCPLRHAQGPPCGSFCN